MESSRTGFDRWLRERFPSGRIRFQEPMSLHTTFRTGGPARYMAMPANEEEIRLLVMQCQSVGLPWFVVGNGSNLLVSDRGYDGLIIKLGRQYSGLSADGLEIRAQAGVMLSKLSRQAALHHLAGLAFAAGIPGTLGGGLMMNAGAYGGELSQVVKTVRVLDGGGRFRTLTAEQMKFGYRTSILKEGGLIALEAVLSLAPGDKEEQLLEMEQLNRKRREKQPLEYASAGSTFKRPEGYFAGQLIEQAGLKGLSVGDAQVSEKHCGFVINRGNATAAEIYTLCRKVQERVFEQFQVELTMEVRLLGEF